MGIQLGNLSEVNDRKSHVKKLLINLNLFNNFLIVH